MPKTLPRRQGPPRHTTRQPKPCGALAPGTARLRPGVEHPPDTSRWQVVALVLVVALFGVLGGGYVLTAILRPAHTAAAALAPAPPSQLAAILAQLHLVFIQPSGADPITSQLEVVPLAHLDQRAASEINCARAYYAAGHGVCAGTTPRSDARVFDSQLQATSSIQLDGVPSRVRISPNGRLAATTVFVVGHGYASIGFSTRTTIDDLAGGQRLDLENLVVTKDGARIQAADFNFWGVTFEADSDGFYATLGTAGHTYLIHGRYSTHSAQVVRDGVECPSLSPDGAHIVYKSLVPGVPGIRTWRLHVLDLTTMRDTALGDTRSVDDQVEWLDNATVLYGLHEEGPPATLDMDLWSLRIDPNAKPVEFLPQCELSDGRPRLKACPGRDVRQSEVSAG